MKHIFAVVWTIPLILSLATAGGWNCTERCTCLTRCYSQVELSAFPRRHCRYGSGSVRQNPIVCLVVVQKRINDVHNFCFGDG